MLKKGHCCLCILTGISVVQEGEMSTRAHILVAQNLTSLFNLSPHASIHPRDDGDPAIQVERCDFQIFCFGIQGGAIGDFAICQTLYTSCGSGKANLTTPSDGEIVGKVAKVDFIWQCQDMLSYLSRYIDPSRHGDSYMWGIISEENLEASVGASRQRLCYLYLPTTS
jgi:hypothetical protein